jgi:hypothetical protein
MLLALGSDTNFEPPRYLKLTHIFVLAQMHADECLRGVSFQLFLWNEDYYLYRDYWPFAWRVPLRSTTTRLP